MASTVSHKVDIVLEAVHAIPKLEIHNGDSTHNNVLVEGVGMPLCDEELRELLMEPKGRAFLGVDGGSF